MALYLVLLGYSGTLPVVLPDFHEGNYWIYNWNSTSITRYISTIITAQTEHYTKKITIIDTFTLYDTLFFAFTTTDSGLRIGFTDTTSDSLDFYNTWNDTASIVFGMDTILRTNDFIPLNFRNSYFRYADLKAIPCSPYYEFNSLYCMRESLYHGSSPYWENDTIHYLDSCGIYDRSWNYSGTVNGWDYTSLDRVYSLVENDHRRTGTAIETVPQMSKTSTPFRLSPRPICGSGMLEIQNGVKGRVTFELYDCTGRHIRTVFNSKTVPTAIPMRFDVSYLTNGVYLARIRINSRHYSERLIILK